MLAATLSSRLPVPTSRSLAALCALPPWDPPASEVGASWLWPAAVLAAVAVACAAWWRARSASRRLDALAAEAREAHAAASAHEKELERVRLALEARVSELSRALANERRLFDAGPVTMFRWRAAEGWPVEYVSPNVAQIFGWKSEDFTSGRVRYADVVSPEDLERVGREVAEHSARGGTYFEQDYRVVHRDGTQRWLYDITLIERDVTGAITHYVGYVLDRTERVQAENERRALEDRLQATQRLESLGVLAGGIAHDFNNLMVGVLGNAGLALERLRPDDPARELIAGIEQSARRAGELTQQMLAYAGKARVSFQLVDLNAAIDAIAELLRASVAKTATFELRPAEVAPHVVGDPAQLDQVFMNLITNASDALGDRPGRIVVATGERELSSAELARLHGAPSLEPGRYAYVEVADDGRGMTPATLARMFEPFFTTKFAGRGLGLAAALGIARAHRGGLEVESEPGRGTRVRFYLPAAGDGARAQPRAVPRSAPPAILPRTTVLVVDDEPAVQKLAARVLASRGLDVLVAGDGEQALGLHAQHAPSIACVLLDLTMPKLSGAETFRALRERAPDLPVIVTSGYSESEALEQLDSRVGTYFLQKPFGPTELVAQLARALGEG